MVIDWAAWGPTIVSILMAVFMAGSMFKTINDHDKRLSSHDSAIKEVADRCGVNELSLAELKAWRDGYNAATSAITKHGE